jgi:aspartate 1-decarboxylase
MKRSLLLAKLHNCTLTGANLEYMGSVSIDRTLLEAAGIVPYEQVQIVNIANGSRLMTYAIEAPADSGIIELNGAAARLGSKGDRVIIMTYAELEASEIAAHRPTVVMVGQGNQILEVAAYPDVPTRFGRNNSHVADAADANVLA